MRALVQTPGAQGNEVSEQISQSERERRKLSKQTEQFLVRSVADLVTRSRSGNALLSMFTDTRGQRFPAGPADEDTKRYG
ncbi:hypothetical protein [Roseibium sp.]|uniref:hypothetical protein n=1 Tax=Roseibium sp. TaxID=1936156 RepID=UPI0032677780